LVRSIGANDVIDYSRENFTRSGQHYDVILDNAGNHSLGEYRRVLSKLIESRKLTSVIDRTYPLSQPQRLSAMSKLDTLEEKSSSASELTTWLGLCRRRREVIDRYASDRCGGEVLLNPGGNL
jgi:NADPH:quinone reductase-like Zn-dependent oxidoreductase